MINTQTVRVRIVSSGESESTSHFEDITLDSKERGESFIERYDEAIHRSGDRVVIRSVARASSGQVFSSVSGAAEFMGIQNFMSHHKQKDDKRINLKIAVGNIGPLWSEGFLKREGVSHTLSTPDSYMTVSFNDGISMDEAVQIIRENGFKGETILV